MVQLKSSLHLPQPENPSPKKEKRKYIHRHERTYFSKKRNRRNANTEIHSSNEGSENQAA
jgi:hypothetical protein